MSNIENETNEFKNLGFIMLPTAMLFDDRLTPLQKMLWCLLEKYAGYDRKCYPSVQTLSKALNKSVRYVYDNLNSLEQYGLVKKVARPGKTTRYDLVSPEKVYCEDGGEILTQDTVDMFNRCDCNLANKIVSRRVSYECDFEEMGSSGCFVSGKDDCTPDFKSALDRVGIVRNKSESAVKRRVERKKKLSQLPPQQKEKPEPKKPKGLNTKDIEEEWSLSAHESFPNVPSLRVPFDGMSCGIAKNLGDRYGYDVVIKLIYHVMSNWVDYVDRYNLKGYPSMRLISAYIGTWLPELEGGKITAKTPKEKAIANREYDEESAKKFPTIYYGEDFD